MNPILRWTAIGAIASFAALTVLLGLQQEQGLPENRERPLSDEFDQNFDAELKPAVKLLPAEMRCRVEQSKFVQEELLVVNSGRAPLQISSVRASCYCANAVVLNSSIMPGDTGSVLLRINTEKFSDTLNVLTYTFRSNVPDSSIRYRVFVSKSFQPR